MNGKKRRVSKRYVTVYACMADDGRVMPVRVCWSDGRSFPIDEVVGIVPPGPVIKGMRTAVYTVRFGDWETELYLEQPVDDGHDEKCRRARWWVWAFDNEKRLGGRS